MISADSGTNTVSVRYTSSADYPFQSLATLPVGNSPRAVVAADINRDGWLDLITANFADHSISLLTNNGSRSFGFALANSLYVGTNPVSVTVADVNGDGSPDF